jgi:hypothetical protein
VGLICVAGRWALSPLVARVASIANGGKLFMTLGMLHIFLGAVYERSSLHLFGSINSRVSGVDSLILPFHSLL